MAREAHVKLQRSNFYPEFRNIFTSLEGIVVGTSMKVISKIGYDQITISYRNVPLKALETNPKNHKKHRKIKMIFYPSWCIIMMDVTYVQIISKFGNNQIKIIYI